MAVIVLFEGCMVGVSVGFSVGIDVGDVAWVLIGVAAALGVGVV